ncbi:MAG TPA: hypothetical protein VGQ22_08140 [Steroidobacteraceae bacterium]|nr:hypothetical protein [Steroidobacteraceae bacterium]
MRFAAVGLALLSVMGCSQDAMLQKFASAEDQATAKKYVDYLRTGQYQAIEAVTDPSIKGPTLRATLEQMASAMPDEEPTSIKLVGAQSVKGPNGTTKNLSFEYGFGEKSLLVNVATLRKGDSFTIIGFNVYPQAQSLAERNRFELAGKTPLQYLILALAILMPLLSLYALIRCAMTKMASKKWLWIVVILIGVGNLAVNWTTGAWEFKPLAIQLLSASVITDAQGAWILAVSVPLGAILFLFRRRLPIRQDDDA